MAMRIDEALWTIQFEVAGEWRTGGVVVFDRGRIFGGDSHYYYFGRYGEEGALIKGEARIVHFNGPLATGFGNSPDFTIVIEARHHDTTITGHIRKPEQDGARLPIRLVRRETLPPAIL